MYKHLTLKHLLLTLALLAGPALASRFRSTHGCNMGRHQAMGCRSSCPG